MFITFLGYSRLGVLGVLGVDILLGVFGVDGELAVEMLLVVLYSR